MGALTCMSCRYYRSYPAQPHGTCTHPDRQFAGAPITIRAAELNCYRGFGIHDWMPAMVGQPSIAQDILISERPSPRWRPSRIGPINPQIGVDGLDLH